MLKAQVYTIKGESKGELSLPKEYGEKYSPTLISQAVRVYENGLHFGLAKTKTRAEINKTKKKLYKQKGTGGARHGSKRAPIFVGGGVAHGRKGIKRFLDLPLKMKKLALVAALNEKFGSKKAVLVEGISKVSKTNEASKMINALKKVLESNGKVLVALSKENMNLVRNFKNIEGVNTVSFESLNAFSVKMASLLIVDKKLFETKEEKVTETKKVSKKEVKK